MACTLLDVVCCRREKWKKHKKRLHTASLSANELSIILNLPHIQAGRFNESYSLEQKNQLVCKGYRRWEGWALCLFFLCLNKVSMRVCALNWRVLPHAIHDPIPLPQTRCTPSLLPLCHPSLLFPLVPFPSLSFFILRCPPNTIHE